MALMHLLLALAVVLTAPASAKLESEQRRNLAQLGFGPGGLFGPPATPTPPGAGRSPADVICQQTDLSTFCQLIRSARQDPTVAELFDPTLVATIFAPDNQAFQDDQRRITRNLGVASVADLQRSPALAARLISQHIITGQALQFQQLQNGQKYRNAAGSTLEINTGFLYGKYVKGPTNTVRMRETAGKNDIPAGRSYVHIVHGVIVPRKQ